MQTFREGFDRVTAFVAALDPLVQVLNVSGLLKYAMGRAGKYFVGVRQPLGRALFGALPR